MYPKRPLFTKNSSSNTPITLLLFFKFLNRLEMGPDPTQPQHFFDPQKLRGQPGFDLDIF